MMNVQRRAQEITYFIQAEIGGPIKIGRSVHVLGRLKELQSNSPFKLKVIREIPGGGWEYVLHQKFDAVRSHSEWFLPDAQLISFLQSLEDGIEPDEALRRVTLPPRRLSRGDNKGSKRLERHLESLR